MRPRAAARCGNQGRYFRMSVHRREQQHRLDLLLERSAGELLRGWRKRRRLSQLALAAVPRRFARTRRDRRAHRYGDGDPGDTSMARATRRPSEVAGDA